MSITTAPATLADLESVRVDLPLDTVRRSIKTEWVLDTHDGVEHGRPARFTTVVVLDSYHSKEGKRFRCSINWRKRVKEQGSRFTTDRWFPFSQAGGTIVTNPVPRYSAKSLQEFHDACLEYVRDNFDVVRPVFEQAFEQQGNDDD